MVAFENDLNYCVWGSCPTYLEEPPMLKQLSRFRFLQEAIDYAIYATSPGSPVVLTGPYGLATRYENGAMDCEAAKRPVEFVARQF